MGCTSSTGRAEIDSKPSVPEPPAYTETAARPSLWRPEYVLTLPSTKREPMLLLDTTGSFTYQTSITDATQRHVTAHEMIKTLVRELEGDDAQAEHEDTGGGVRTVTFAGGKGIDRGDWNSGNFEQEWSRIHWASDTHLMPGWRKLKDVYYDEFPSVPRPLLMAVVVTDGEATDLLEFEQALASDPDAYVVIVTMGYGLEHAAVMRSFSGIAARNPRIRVVDFQGGVDPVQVALLLKCMVTG